MIYRTNNIKEAEVAFEYLNKLVGEHAVVDIKKVNPKRSLNQNAYYHLLMGIFGLEFGWTIEESKVLHKREVSQQIFIYEKNGRKFIRSTADLTTKEMTDAIEQFRKYSAENGLYLPEPNDIKKLNYYSNLIEQQGRYL